MEGKALLFKHFAGIDAVPICLDTTDVDELVDTVARLAPTFGGINLEDISAPRCFEVERRLQERLDIPVFHDDQHGTAVVVLAALTNAARVLGRDLAGLRVVVAGPGRPGWRSPTSCSRPGCVDLVVCDSRGHRRAGPGRPGPAQAGAGRADQPPRPARRPGRGAGRRRRVHRGLRRHGPGGAGGDDGARTR